MGSDKVCILLLSFELIFNKKVGYVKKIEIKLNIIEWNVSIVCNQSMAYFSYFIPKILKS